MKTPLDESGHTMTWRTFLAIALLGRLVSCCAEAEAADTRPNFVFIISDDQDNEHLGFMGNPAVHTPTIDGLANAGAVFTTAHLPMSRCHPTLASFLSGRYPHQSGIYYNFGTKRLSPENSLPNLLKSAGYATFVDGKYWEGDPRAMGFTHGAGKDNQFVRQGQQRAMAFLDEVGGKQPFFMWWAPMLPHSPHNPPEKYLKLFERDSIPMPDWYHGDKEAFRKKEHLSFAMEAWLDDGVSQLMAKLREMKLDGDTMVVFVIDNGWCNGLVSKGSPFEKGVRTPVFFAWPGKIEANQRFDVPISTLDLYPTILDYAGVKAPASAVGSSLRSVIEGKAIEGHTYKPRDTLYGAIYPAFATKSDQRPERDIYALYARTNKWKYIYYLQDVRKKRNGDYFRIQSILTDYPTRDAGDEDLYDLENDPHELNDLAGKTEHASRLADFKRQALDWWKSTGGRPFDVPERSKR